MSTIDFLERDLLDCGIPLGDVERVGIRYARALETHSHIDWIELYVGIFATLRSSLHRTGPATSDALQRMLLLMNDDLGCTLFSPEARAELAASAVAELAHLVSS